MATPVLPTGDAKLVIDPYAYGLVSLIYVLIFRVELADLGPSAKL